MLLLYLASARSSVLMHATVILKPLVFWHRSFELKNELFQVIIVCAMIQHFQNNADHIDAAKKMSNFFMFSLEPVAKLQCMEKMPFEKALTFLNLIERYFALAYSFFLQCWEKFMAEETPILEEQEML